MNLFAMVTTRHSNTFTDLAVSSLVAQTRLETDDEVVVIDNDNAYAGIPDSSRDKVRLHVNAAPRSFAANVNQALEWARGRKADVVFLNNDVVFSHGWFEPLRSRGPFMLSPVSNAELQYAEGGLECKLGMDIEDYLGKEQQFREIVRRHRNRAHGYLKVISFPFFAVKIPYEVYSVIGLLDESFGVGGGEDKDYCIRCHQQGMELRFALNSYILHFQGKSTWRGAETKEQTAARDRVYIGRFRQKWGTALSDLMVHNNIESLSPELKELFDRNEFQELIRRMTAPANPA